MAEARLFLITGIPGVGKTTLISKVVVELRKAGISVGGIYSKEKRAGRVRTGFVMTDLVSGFQKELASVEGEGPRMGRYRVNLKNLGEFAAPAVEDAVSSCDIVVVDEVGPMELISPEFRRAVKHVADSSKPALMVIHLRMRDPLIDEIKSRDDAIAYEVTPDNRNQLEETLLKELSRLLKLER
jgi:nucleoside-triphosphatase